QGMERVDPQRVFFEDPPTGSRLLGLKVLLFWRWPSGAKLESRSQDYAEVSGRSRRSVSLSSSASRRHNRFHFPADS
ncbi:MAG: hypothetical protein ACLGIS_13595, partial [Actinomycetes bacterium]